MKLNNGMSLVNGNKPLTFKKVLKESEDILVLNPSGDAYIYDWAPDGNNDDLTIVVYGGGAGDQQFGLLDFDISGLTQVQQVILRLYNTVEAPDMSVEIKMITSPWSESTVTWNTKPTFSDKVYWSSTVTGSIGWKEFDITELIIEAIQNENFAGLCLYNVDDPVVYAAHSYSSKEGSRKPELRVDEVLQDILISECDNLDTIAVFACDSSLDSENKDSGDASVKLIKNTVDFEYFTVDFACVKDLSGYTKLKYRFYVADKSNIAVVSAVFFTTDPYSYDLRYTHYVGWQIVNGWNTFEIDLADFEKTGEANWATVRGLRFTVTVSVNNASEEVNFDRVEILL